MLSTHGEHSTEVPGQSKDRRVQLAVLAGVCILAFEPAQWLLASWFDPVWNSNGWLLAIVVALLTVWSITSPRLTAPTNVRWAWVILIASAAIRLASQVLGVSFIGAVTLACDIYALALILGTHQRARALSPTGLAVLFFVSLPLERVLQRLLGFGLQQFSAKGACGLLNALGFAPDCDGVSILVAGHNVLVDAPCSGARGLLLVVALFVVVVTIQRPRAPHLIIGVIVALAAAWAGNALRITLLAIGIVEQDRRLSFNVMEAPWHELIGIVTLGLSLFTVLVWSSFCDRSPVARRHRGDAGTRGPAPRRSTVRSNLRAPLALVFAAAALVIVNLPARPIDVSAPTAAVKLPTLLADRERERLPLSDLESQYFTQYGGVAERARYGSHGLLIVRTTSPLRHLHAPDECLRALGHEVRYLGLVGGVLPASVYRSRDGDGQSWHVSVSFVSQSGDVVTSIAHAVWLWLKEPTGSWTMVQRIRALYGDPAADEDFDRGIARFLDLHSMDPIRPTLYAADLTAKR